MGKDEEELLPQVVLMSLLTSSDVGVHVNNDVVGVAIIGHDVTELAVNKEHMCSRKTVNMGCA